MLFAGLFSLLAVLPWVSAYTITENIVGSAFFDKFDWQNIADPTHGRVNYVDQNTARNQGLAYVNGNSFVLRADYKTTLYSGGPGRNSNRIRSKRTYTTHVAIFDTKHMPQGCGTWPAIWETKESNWPAGGEVDIVEGVNDQSPNAAALHTTAGCSMPSSGRNMFGTAGQLDCNYQVNSNTGCGVRFPDSNSYGPNFNNNGGGWFAFERTNNYMRIWFWPRNSQYVPAEVKNGASTVNTAGWGTPSADFPNNQCNIPQYFQEHHIIINLTFCGDWAGSVYGQSGCPSSCDNYVNTNPGAFQNAYFEFNAIRIYT